MDLFAPAGMLALFRLKEIRMVLLLFPAVRIFALVLHRAAFTVRSYYSISVPRRAHLGRVAVKRGFTAVILPIVRVDTSLSIVVIFSVRTPNSLEVKQIKIHVNLVALDQLDRDLVFCVGKGTKLFVIAAVLRTGI